MANGKKISKKQAIDWVKKFKSNNPKSTFAESFDANLVQELLRIGGCVTVRIHLAEDDNKKTRLVLVAVDANDNAILPANELSTTEPAFILEDGKTCPPFCGSGDL
jgi:hypothetical protein